MRIRSPHEEDYRRYLGDDMISHVMEEDGVLNVKAVVGSFNQEKDLEGAFSVIVKSWRNLREPSFEALHLTRTPHCRSAWEPGPS